MSSVLGDKASADVIDSLSFADSGSVAIIENSQTMVLLQTSASSLLLLDKTKKDTENKENEIKNDVNVEILSGNALLPANDLMVIADETEIGGPDQISVYVVRKGDTVSQIAEMFDVSVNTILWANDIKKTDTIKEGDIFLILPISGVKHIVTRGQTLNGIAKFYKVDVSDITRFNGMTEEEKLAVGDEIIIPGGEIYNESIPSTYRTSSPGAVGNLINAVGYFINPVPDYTKRSQGLHGPGNRGIDLAAPTGTSILASAEGKVFIAKNGWNGGYGNMVIVQHLNGTKTLYAHMSKIKTATGTQVSRGEIIGSVGSTGRSTGPHLHFEVFNAKNPGATTPMSFAMQ